MGDELRSAVDIAMAGERPMDSNNSDQSQVPIQSALEKAMAGERPPIQHTSNISTEPSQPSIPGVNAWESQGSSQTDIDLNKFNETLSPSTSTVVENWSNNMSNSPSIVVATENQTPVTPEDVSIENARLKEELEALKLQVAELSKKFDDPNVLQNALDPNKPKSADQLEVDQAYATINKDLNQKALNEIDQIKTMLEPKTPPVTTTPITPELTTTTAAESAEKDHRERNYKRAALIAGVVVGGAGGVLGGTPVATVGALASVGAGFLNSRLDIIGGRRIEKLTAQLNITTDLEQRANLEKRINNWEKVRKGTQYAAQFFKGAAIGFAASGIAMGIFNGGHGLVWNKPEIPTGIPTTNAEASIGKTGIEQGTGAETPLPSSPETYQGNSFIHDGRVDLPGSAWDGNMAGGPAQDTLAGGAENFSNYSGGPSEMAANQLGQDLASNNITDELLSNLTTYDKHRLLTEYWNAVRGGNANPDFIETLRSMNTDGAQKLLTAIGK